MGVITNPIPRTEITFAERCAIERLARCTFTPGSAHKRFARNMRGALDLDPKLAASGITDGQRDQLWRLVYRYRRQILQQEHLKDAQLFVFTDGALGILHQIGNRTHIKELVDLAAQIMDRVGLRRRVAALRREALQA